MTSIRSVLMALGRAAKRELLKLFALAPVRRGEGRVRGLRDTARRALTSGNMWGPLTLALSPEDRGEGTGRLTPPRESSGRFGQL